VRVARSRRLVAEGYALARVARVMQISRQALCRLPSPRAAPQRRPVTDPVERAIVEEATANQTDGYRMVCAFVRRRLGVAVNRKRVLRVMRERKLIQRRRPLERRRRPGFFRVERPRQLWQLDMTSIWVAEQGWCYLNAIIDCCTREIVAWQLELRCRADEAIALAERAAAVHAIQEGELTLGSDNGSAFTAPPLPCQARRARHPPSPRRLPRPPEPGLHRELVREAERTGGVAERVRDPRRRPTRDRRLRRALPPPPAQRARIPHPARGATNLGGSTENRGLTCQLGRGAGAT
jgi:Integrase core domain/HTH-like domain